MKEKSIGMKGKTQVAKTFEAGRAWAKGLEWRRGTAQGDLGEL